MSITVVNSLSHLRGLTSSPAQISIIDFHATWCGPCKAIAPVYLKLSTTYTGRVQFLKVDVDQARDVAQHFQVTAMPTFAILKGTNKIDEMKGANPAGLEAMVRKHAPAQGAAAASGSGSSSAPPTEKGLEGFVNLNDTIDFSKISCLNESADHTIRHLLKGGGDKWLESDSDEQLLLHLYTNTTIKLRALRLTTLPSAFSQAPKTIKLFVNQPTIGFDDADSLEAAQEVILTEAQAKGTEAIQLRFVRFQNVFALSIFVSENQGGEDVSRIDKLELIGASVNGTDMSQLSKGDDDHNH